MPGSLAGSPPSAVGSSPTFTVNQSVRLEAGDIEGIRRLPRYSPWTGGGGTAVGAGEAGAGVGAGVGAGGGGTSSCQWPCSGDQTLPSGVGPGGCGVTLASSVDVEVKFPPPLMACAAGASGSCQWPCSGDQTLPSGAGPDGCDIRPLGRPPLPPAKGIDRGVDIGAEEFIGAFSERSEDAGQKKVWLTTTANATPPTPIAK